MGLIDKAKEVSGQAVEMVGEKVGELGGDDLNVNTVIRVAAKPERIYKLLQERGYNYRFGGIDVENSIPPKVVLTLAEQASPGVRPEG